MRHDAAAASLLVLLALSGCGSSGPETNTDPEATVREVADRWLAATNAGDLDGVMEVLTTDGAVLFPGMAPLEGHEAIREVYRGYYDAWSLDYDYRLDEAVAAGDFLVARATVTGSRTSKADGESSPQAFNNLWILKRSGGSWKFWRAMFNEAAPPGG